MDMMSALAHMAKIVKAKGADDWDIMGGESRSLEVSAFEQKIQNTEVSASRGIGIRVLLDGKPGYASTERLSESALDQTVDDALSHAKLTGSLNITLPGPSEATGPDLPVWHEALEQVSLEEMAGFALKLEKIALDASETILNVPYLGTGRNRNKFWMMNSRGFSHEEERNSWSAGLGAVAVKNEIKKVGIASRSGRDFSLANAQEISLLAVERALELLEPKPLPQKPMPVLLQNRIAGQLMSMFSSPFYADSVQKGLSRLQGKLGEQIATKDLTILCDPHRTDLPGSRLFDGEGIPTTPMEVISGGNLKSYLYNLESAARDNTQPTGNGTRSWSGKAGTSFSNYIIQPGKLTDQELRNQAPCCFEVVKLEGASGCSAISGQISIGAQGFYVENGVRQFAVEGVTLNTNFFDLLNALIGIGSEYNDQFSSVRVPSLLADNIALSC